VSCLQYDRAHSDFLLSAGYDKKLHIWNMMAETPKLAKTLGQSALTSTSMSFVHTSFVAVVCQPVAGHEGKVMGFDCFNDELIVTVGYDRTFKTWF
jgi:WD40 repeat protein